MKLIATLLLLASSSAFAGHVIEVTEPAFTAERIELNPVTNTYVVVSPKYYINGAIAVPTGYITYNGGDAVQHLCTFLGMTGGKVISSGDCQKPLLLIEESGLYSYQSFDGRSSCRTIEFLECSSKP